MRSLIASVLLGLLTLAPARAQDADAVLRVGRLESQLRQLSGQIEQLQFQNKRLEDQLRKFQADTEFRFQELTPSPKVAAPAPTHPAPATTATVHPKSAPSTTAPKAASPVATKPKP
jgi:TolA-binding protein